LIRQLDFVSKVVKEEEEAFLRTLDKGLKKMDDIIERANADKKIQGPEAFELYDTYGFPIDLTRLIASENQLTVDEPGFEAEMKKQKDRSRAATALETDDWVHVNDGNSSFIGYDSLETETKLLRYRKVKSKGKESYQLVLEKTPFYAESGGQVGDTGVLSADGVKIKVSDTKKENDLIIQFTEESPEKLKGIIKAAVDAPRRRSVTVHHSATHLMHSALREVLGNHVAQKGSLVNEEQLRFDFSHFAKMTDEEIRKVEDRVNEKIRENVPVVIKSMPKEEAIKLGAMALFGEKYGDTVRVVIMDPSYSIELCGGTHVGYTGEIGLFRVKSESAVAAGVRRIEAVCGKAAEADIREQAELLDQIGALLKNPKDLLKQVEGMIKENQQLNKRIEALEARQLVGIRNEQMHKDAIIDNVTFIGDIVEVNDADALKKLCFELKHHVHDHLAVLCSNIGGKPFVAIGMSDTVAAAKNLDASKIIKEHVSGMIRGGGGGQKTLATAGGQDPSRLKEVIDTVRSLIKG
jgi:alanyl-tRNA synthetase